MEHFAYGTLEQTVQATVRQILIPDVVQSGPAYRAAVRTGEDELLWVDGVEQRACDAWDAALDQIERMCEERLLLSAQAAVGRYLDAVKPAINGTARGGHKLASRIRRDYAALLLQLHQLRDEDLDRVLANHLDVLTLADVRNLDARTLSHLRLEADDSSLAG
jgi:hypothetical protein